jgi:hypothetical protein
MKTTVTIIIEHPPKDLEMVKGNFDDFLGDCPYPNTIEYKSE